MTIQHEDDGVWVTRKVSHLQIEQDCSDPHGLADFQAVGEEREAWRALVIGWQNLNVDCSDGAPDSKEEWKLVSWWHRFLRPPSEPWSSDITGRLILHLIHFPKNELAGFQMFTDCKYYLLSHCVNILWLNSCDGSHTCVTCLILL